jgi:hypothetical protein
MSNIQDLKKATADFFGMHWNKSSSEKIPEWSEAWTFFDTLPNNEQAGCYAFAVNEEVKYVGVALNSGVAGYKNHSLGTRISNYWRVDKGVAKQDGKTSYMASENLHKEGITAIYTLGIPEEQKYLAIALELFLIRKLKPSMNKVYNTPEIETA